MQREKIGERKNTSMVMSDRAANCVLGDKDAGKSRNSLLVISFILRRRQAWSFFSLPRKKKKKEKSLLKGNKGVRRHKGRLSTFHGADKRKKISAPANYNRGDERDGRRQKRKKIPPFFSPERRWRGQQFPPETQSCGGRRGEREGEVDLMDVEVISGRSTSLSCLHRVKN